MGADAMYCRNCGAEVNPGAKFCVKCGTSLQGPQPSQAAPANQPGPAGAAASQRVPSGSAVPTGGPVRSSVRPAINLKAIVALLVAVVVVVGGYQVISWAFGRWQLTSVAKEGISSELLSDGYVNLSGFDTSSGDRTYTLSKFKATEADDSQEVYALKSSVTDTSSYYDDAKVLICTGTITNSYVQTEFEVYAALGSHDGGDWEFVSYSTINIISTPLVGVGVWADSNYTEKGFSCNGSTPEEETAGVWYSTATGTSTINSWFGSDTITISQEYYFSGSSYAGWQPIGSDGVETVSISSDWGLVDQPITVTKEGGTDSTVTFTLTFTSITYNLETELYDVSATYELVSEVTGSGSKFQEFDVSGTLTGTLDRPEGLYVGTFSYSISDGDAGVSISGEGHTGNNYLSIALTSAQIWYGSQAFSSTWTVYEEDIL